MSVSFMLALFVILAAAIANAFSAIEFAVKAQVFCRVVVRNRDLLLVAGASFVLAMLAH